MEWVYFFYRDSREAAFLTEMLKPFRGVPGGEDAAPLRHRVWKLPEIKPQVIEYQRHRLACPCCGETTCAASGEPALYC